MSTVFTGAFITAVHAYSHAAKLTGCRGNKKLLCKRNKAYCVDANMSTKKFIHSAFENPIAIGAEENYMNNAIDAEEVRELRNALVS